MALLTRQRGKLGNAAAFVRLSELIALNALARGGFVRSPLSVVSSRLTGADKTEIKLAEALVTLCAVSHPVVFATVDLQRHVLRRVQFSSLSLASFMNRVSKKRTTRHAAAL